MTVLNPRKFAAAILLAFVAAVGFSSDQALAQGDAPSEQPAAENGAASPAAKPVPAAKPGEKLLPPVTDKIRPVLPSDFVPPVELPPGSSSDEEWIVKFGDGSDKALRDARSKYNSIRDNGKFNNQEERGQFIKYLQWKLSQLTLRDNVLNPKNQQNLKKWKMDVLSDIRKAGRANRAFRGTVMNLIVQEAPELFKYHFISRIGGAVILSALNETDKQGNTRAVPFLAAARPLLDLFKQKQQTKSVRLVAAAGLKRMVKDGQPNDELTLEIIDAFVDELQNGNPKYEHLQNVVISGLGMIRKLNDSTGKPTVPYVLTQTLADHRRPLRSRAEAAKALGRLPLDNSFNIELISYEIVKLVDESAEAFQQEADLALKNKDPEKRKPNYAKWRWTFGGLYIAFNGDSKISVSRGDGLSRKTFSAAKNNFVRDAYKQMIPIVQANLRGEMFDAQHLGAVQQWLQANIPQNRKVQDAFPAINSRKSAPKLGAKAPGKDSASQ